MILNLLISSEQRSRRLSLIILSRPASMNNPCCNPYTTPQRWTDDILMKGYNTPAAERPRSEIEEHDGREVRLTGVVHRVPPSRGQAPDLAGILDVESIEAVDPPGRLDSQQKENSHEQ